MIVFDLRCAGGHVFEAWFGSTGAWEEQRAAGQVRCPLCDSGEVDKAVMAPNIAAKANSRSSSTPTPAQMKAAVRAIAAAQAKVLEGSTWVGPGFAGRARAMHDGEEAHAPIHGQASLAEAKALVEDGVPIAPLPLPVVPPDQVN
jgi:hypothetical protein